MMIPSVIIEGSRIAIPVFGSPEHCILIWNEEESTEDFLKRAMQSEHTIGWCSVHVWNKYTEDDGEPFTGEGIFYIHVYDIFCSETNRKFHLIAYDDLGEFDDIEHCVCLPFNRLNLLAFYRDYIIPFANKKFYHG
jgi:hypothetical protein